MLKRLETSLDIVAQSFMVFSDFMGAFSSVGRAPALQAGGRRFGSDMVHPMSSLTWWEKKNGCGSSSVGRASPFQGEGRGFEPRLPLKNCIHTYQQVAPTSETAKGV